MSSGCGDVLSLEDLKTAKLHQIFEAEVVTGRAGGVAAGASIDYATNPVTGQVQKTLPAILRDLGYEPASFDFTTGGTLTVTDRNKAVLWPVSSGGDGDYYYWEGALPKVIPASSSPGSTGGVAEGAWRPVSDVTLRGDFESFVSSLASVSDGEGDALVGVKAPYSWGKPRTQHLKNTDFYNLRDAIGVDPTGATDSTLGIQNCLNQFAITGGTVYIGNGDVFLCGSLTIPQNVALIGSLHTPGEVKQSLSQSYYSFGSQLRLSTGATITLERGASLKNALIIRNGLTLNPATDSAAAALVASFSGTALTSIQPDVTFENLLVLGFTYAYNSAPTTADTGRANFINFHFDCTHGIRKEYSVDIDRLYGVHGWPYLTAHISTVTAASSLARSGNGVYLKNVADWTQCWGVFTYGYAQGAVLDGVWNCQLNNCGFDACGTTGVSVLGASRFNRMNNTFINSNVTAVSINTSGSNPDFKTTNCVINGVTNGVYVTAGSYFSLGDTFMGGAGVAFTDGTISGGVHNVYFDGCAAPFSLTTNAAKVVSISGISYSGSQPVITQSEKRFATQTVLLDKRATAAGVGHILEQGGMTNGGFPIGYWRQQPRLTGGTPGNEASTLVWTNFTLGSWIDKMQLTASALSPVTDAAMQLGTGALRWGQIYSNSSAISTSDANSKTDIRSLSDKELAVAKSVKNLVRAYKFNDAVSEKGEDGARIHFGVIAQDVVEAFEQEGLDPMKYGIVCFDEWGAQDEVVSHDEEGKPYISQHKREAGNRYGIRYEELLCFLISAM